MYVASNVFLKFGSLQGLHRKHVTGDAADLVSINWELEKSFEENIMFMTPICVPHAIYYADG